MIKENLNNGGGYAKQSIVLIGVKKDANLARLLLSVITGIASGMMRSLVAVKPWQSTSMRTVNVWEQRNDNA